MIPFPRYVPERRTLEVWAVTKPFPAGSLVARRLGDELAVASPVDGTLVCGWFPFDQWTLPDGVTTLPDADSAFAYLDGQCSALPPIPAPLRTVVLDVAAPGQTDFPVAPAPADVNSIVALVNGIAYRAPAAFTFSAARGLLTWAGDFDLIPGDDFVLRYT